MASRRKAREFALQMLFQQDITAHSNTHVREGFWKSRRTDSDTRRFADELFLASLDHKSEMDERIEKCSENWRVKRMLTVDRNILRMAATEFLYFDTPWVVVIDEAIEIARRYGGEDSPEFVNGILDAVRKDLNIGEDHKAPNGR